MKYAFCIFLQLCPLLVCGSELFGNMLNILQNLSGDENNKNDIEKLMSRIKKLEEENYNLKKEKEEQVEIMRKFIGLVNQYSMDNSLLQREVAKFQCQPKTIVKTQTKEHDGGISEYICTYTQIGYVDENGDCKYLQEELKNCDYVKRIKGCVPGDHMILLDDNTWHPIADLKPGQLYFNGNKAVTIHSVETGFEKKHLIEVEIMFGNEVFTYNYTQNHVFPVKRMYHDMHLTAKDLKMGDMLTYFSRDKENYVLETQVYITSVRQIPGGIYVYNIRSTSPSKTWEDHYMIGNGILSGNLNLQEFVAKENEI